MELKAKQPEIVLEISSTPSDQKKGVQTLNVTPDQAMLMLGITLPKSFVAASSGEDRLPSELTTDKEFWRSLYATLMESAMVSIRVTEGTPVDQVQSLMKMNGFANIQLNSNDGVVVAMKPQFKEGGTSLKNRRKQRTEAPASENPWGNLESNGDTQLINEDNLLKGDGMQQVTGKFGKDSDRIMAGKPCENCTCGKKELFEEAQGKEKLETGQVESSCGKCYLGDAFRCAGCPYLGKPAFEPGDKVKLTNANVEQTATQNVENVRTAQTGSSKVVIEL